MCVHGEKKVFYGVFVVFALLTIVLIIVSLPLPWLGGKVEGDFGVYTYKVTLSSVKVEGNGTLWGKKETISFSELCEESPFNLTSCGVNSTSVCVIVFSVIGLILSFAIWLAVFMDLRCKMSRSILFNIAVNIPITLQSIIYIVLFAVYSASTKGLRKHGLHFHAGWALYLTGMVFSVVICLMAVFGTSIEPIVCALCDL